MADFFELEFMDLLLTNAQIVMEKIKPKVIVIGAGASGLGAA